MFLGEQCLGLSLALGDRRVADPFSGKLEQLDRRRPAGNPARRPVYSDSNRLIEALRQGQCASLTRRSLVHDALQRGKTVLVSEITVSLKPPYWLVWPMRSQGNGKQLAFCDRLLREVRIYRTDIG